MTPNNQRENGRSGGDGQPWHTRGQEEVGYRWNGQGHCGRQGLGRE